ncbi:MAG: hypothetical protein Q9217_001361 [Psora testacea]
MTGEVAASLAVGYRLRGKVGSYKVLEQFTKDRDVWKAIDENARQVVIKRAPPHLLSIEREILEIVQNHKCIRQMIDNIDSPSSLVLEYLDDNLLDVCSRKRLEGSDVKVVARTVLEALAVLHENGFVHTDGTERLEVLDRNEWECRSRGKGKGKAKISRTSSNASFGYLTLEAVDAGIAAVRQISEIFHFMQSYHEEINDVESFYGLGLRQQA